MKPNALPNAPYEFDNRTCDPASTSPDFNFADTRSRINTSLESQPQSAYCLEKASVQADLIGNLYRVQGKAYVLTEGGLVYDFETKAIVMDPTVCDRVFDQYEQDLRTAEAIQLKARELAHGDPDLEEAIRLHLAFTGIPEKQDRSEVEAA